jgi:fatty-acyl-CoA synthase
MMPGARHWKTLSALAVNRGSAVALRYIKLVGPQWLIKTSSGKTARSANREKFLAEMRRSQ